jgi:hypothetical protein
LATSRHLSIAQTGSKFENFNFLLVLSAYGVQKSKMRETVKFETRDCNADKPITGNTGKLVKIAIKIYWFTEGKIPVFSVKN